MPMPSSEQLTTTISPTAPGLLPSGERLPLTEFDDDPVDVVSTAIDHGEITLPERLVLTLAGEVTPRWAEEHGFRQVYAFETITMTFPVWVGVHRDVQIALAEVPMGASAAVAVADDFFRRGVRTVVTTGSCGALVPAPAGAFYIPTKALRDEGTSYHYQPASRWIDLDEDMVRACAEAVAAAGHPYVLTPVWTTDGLFRETRGKITARVAEGCQVVDMECSALTACARFRGIRFGQIVYTADSLADEVHDPRDWGKAFRSLAIDLAADALVRAG
ncbi:Phosphorylase superfamily protein [Austwickia chelonae]|uniref:Uridine phosphorylase n=2 Tax=Austwickia TaxID=1184606 RepID=K6WBY4_9MICO|nr:putative phosphorylase [Austwickia chelonae NBRC 105200]SEW44055.1 Phosphorylase superfamily protein [Austwickia chelonae]